MAKEAVNLGANANDGTGDPLRTAFGKLNTYLAEHDAADLSLASRIAALENANLSLAPINHTHSEYALTNHTHSEYALTNHTHTEYAPINHQHPQHPTLNAQGVLPPSVLPEATEQTLGVVRRATNAAALTGLSNTEYMTPLLTKALIDAQPPSDLSVLTGVREKAFFLSGTNVTIAANYNQYVYVATANFTFNLTSSAPVDEVVSFNVFLIQNSTGGWRGTFNGLTGWFGEIPAVGVPSGQTATVTSPYLDRGANVRGVLTFVRLPHTQSAAGWYAHWVRVV